MKIENMTSPLGNEVANQFKLYYNNFVAFQSYSTLIAVYSHENDVMYIDKEKYSCTTSKYLNMFVNKYQPLTISKVPNSALHRIIERG